MSTHLKTPFSVNNVGDIVDANKKTVAMTCYPLHTKTNVLLAAAPELLALLIEVVSELSDTDDEGLIEHTDWMMKARATIAKAKGE